MNPSTRNAESVGTTHTLRRRASIGVIWTASLAAIGWSLTQAQGPLTPPGTPAPAMKTLQQIEPRTEVNSSNTPGDADSVFRISLPGSYYLSANLTGVSGKHGIEIAVSDVTLDLGGFALTGVAGSLNGVVENGAVEHVVIRNGTARSWGQSGFEAGSTRGCTFEDLRAAGNGGTGVDAGSDAMVTRCVARSNSDAGIAMGYSCTATDCVATLNGFVGIRGFIGCTYCRCTAETNSSSGIEASEGSSLSGCTARDNTDFGIVAGKYSAITNCSAYKNKFTGILTRNALVGDNRGTGCSVTNCTASLNEGDGIQGEPGTIIESCVCDLNKGNGFSLGANCTIHHCNARTNGDNGICCMEQTLALENNCTNNGTNPSGGAGILVAGGQGSRIDSNTLAGNSRGIEVVSDRNLIVRNSCRSNNSHNFVIAAGNRFAQIVVLTANAAALDGDTPAGGATSTDPWANFTF